jgi:hypothetical protein
MPAPLIQRHTSLSAHLVAFGRFLREQGFIIGPAEEALALQALLQLDAFRDNESFQYCLRAVFARSKTQQQRFDELFPRYFKELEQGVDSKIKQDHKKRPAKGRSDQSPSFQALKDWLYGKPASEEVELAAYSAQESLSEKDFSSFSEEELKEIWGLVQQIARMLSLRMSRRWERAHSLKRLDLRRTLRDSLRRGGELLDLRYLRPKKQRQQLVLLCDVSKSMDLYSQFLIQFSYAFQQAYRRIETFVFSTQLERITPSLRAADYREAMQVLSAHTGVWSGGTRIGASLESFYKDYQRLVNNKTVLIILSDGMDTGEPERITQAMQQLHQKAGRIIWLNPLAGRPGYEPSVRGMQAALPYIDVFASAHNLESLRELARRL